MNLDVVERGAFRSIGNTFDADLIARAERQAGDAAPSGRVN
jgi:hypothetical protein